MSFYYYLFLSKELFYREKNDKSSAKSIAWIRFGNIYQSPKIDYQNYQLVSKQIYVNKSI
jgi:hypothetical protein